MKFVYQLVWLTCMILLPRSIHAQGQQKNVAATDRVSLWMKNIGAQELFLEDLKKPKSCQQKIVTPLCRSLDFLKAQSFSAFATGTLAVVLVDENILKAPLPFSYQDLQVSKKLEGEEEESLDLLIYSYLIMSNDKTLRALELANLTSLVFGFTHKEDQKTQLKFLVVFAKEELKMFAQGQRHEWLAFLTDITGQRTRPNWVLKNNLYNEYSRDE
jgi:hypothetical protein